MTKKTQQPMDEQALPKLPQQAKEPTKSITVIRNEHLATIWVDRAEIRIRNDGLSLVSLFAEVPIGNAPLGNEIGIMEVVRFMNSKDHLQRFADAICKTIDYWPERPKQKAS